MVTFHQLQPAPEHSTMKLIRFRPGANLAPPKGPAIRVLNGKLDDVIRIEVPSGKCLGSTRNPQQLFATVIVGGRFRESIGARYGGIDTEMPGRLAANIIREPVTGGDRSLDL